jgi:hypothetical protein
MSPKEKEVLISALNSLNNTFIDYYNTNSPERYDFNSLGKVIIAKRYLAEFLDLQEELNNYLLPGESQIDIAEGDDPRDWYNFTNYSQSENLTEKEKEFLVKQVLPLLDGLSGVYDGDNAVIRCVRRMIAEVARFEPLSKYRLLFENEVSNKYFTNKEK